MLLDALHDILMHALRMGLPFLNRHSLTLTFLAMATFPHSSLSHQHIFRVFLLTSDLQLSHGFVRVHGQSPYVQQPATICN